MEADAISVREGRAAEFQALTGSGATKRFPADKQHAEGNLRHYDFCWAVLFVLHLIAVATTAGVLYSRLTPAAGMTHTTTLGGAEQGLGGHTNMQYLGVALGAGAIAVLGWLVLVRYLARQLLWMAAVAVLALMGYVMAQAIRFKMGEMAAFMGLLVIMYLYVLWSAGQRINFTACMSETSVQVIKDHPGTWLLAVAGIVPVFCWCCVSLMLVVVGANQKEQFGSGGMIALIACALFSLYWTYNVVHGVQHTTVAGVVGRWYFTPAAEALPMPTWTAFKQSMLVNFGAICFGSLLTALVQLIKSVFSAARCGTGGNSVQNCMCCCVGCFIDILDWVLQFVNTYAFVYIAIYPSKFTTAARNAMRLVQATGFDQLYHYNLTGLLMVAGQTCCAAVAGLTARWCTDARMFGVVDPSMRTQLIAVSSTIIFFVTGIACSPVASGVLALIVAFAQEPNALKQAHPACYDKMRNVATDLDLPMAGTHFGAHSQHVVRQQAERRRSSEGGSSLESGLDGGDNTGSSRGRPQGGDYA